MQRKIIVNRPTPAMKHLILSFVVCLLSSLPSFAADLHITRGNWQIEINESTTKATISFNDNGFKTLIKDSELEFRIDNSLHKGSELTDKNLSQSRGKDKLLGDYTRARLEGKTGNMAVVQDFYLFDAFVLTEFTVETSSGAIASNYMAPLGSSSTVDFLPESANRVLMVPFDNDDFVRYSSNEFNQSTTSYEVTAIYNEQSRKGLVIGSVEHDTWKTGVLIAAGWPNRVNSIQAYGGITSYLTRDGQNDKDQSATITPHGKIKQPKIKSPKLFIGYFDDWRRGMEEYAQINAMIAPNYYNWKGSWKDDKPFGWNSWAVLQAGINYENTSQTADWIKHNLQGNSFANGKDEVVYVGLDSFWNEGGFNDESLRKFVEHCHYNGQKAGVYLVPFSHWGGPGNAPHYALRINGEPRMLDGGWALDPTHPDTKKRVIDEYLSRIQRAGFDYIKIDFLSHGTKEADSWHDASVHTGMQAYNHGMKWLADWFRANMPAMYVNLSIAPLFPANYAHSRRISCDAWANISQTEYVLNSLSYGWWADYAYLYNDADHVVLKGVSEGENRARITSSIITGIFILGDDYSNGGDATAKNRSKELLTRPELNRVARQTKAFYPVNSGSGTGAANQFMTTVADTTYLALFNFDSSPASYTINLERIGLAAGKTYQVRDLWRDNSTTQHSTNWSESIPAKDVKLLKIYTSAKKQKN